MNAQLYYFAWGNNEKRVTMKGRVCRVLSRGFTGIYEQAQGPKVL